MTKKGPQMSRTELANVARALGVPVKGSNAQLEDAIKAARRKRAGMELFAKGDKVEVFRAAAEEAGYAVAVRRTRKTGEVVAKATRGDRTVIAAWTASGAWDYGNTWDDAKRGSKMRNLAAAIRSL